MNISIDLRCAALSRYVAVTFSMRGESFVQVMTLDAAMDPVYSRVKVTA